MKTLILFCLLLSTLTLGQFFEQQEPEPQQNNPVQFFDENQYDPEPEYETNGAGDPNDPTPIDDWAFLLPLAGIAVGVYFIRKKWELGTRD